MLSVHLLSAMRDSVFGLVLCMEFLPAEGTNTSITMSHKLSAGIPSSLRPASDEVVFASMHCVTLLFASCTSSVSVRMGGFPKWTACPLTLWSQSGHLQSWRPG